MTLLIVALPERPNSSHNHRRKKSIHSLTRTEMQTRLALSTRKACINTIKRKGLYSPKRIDTERPVSGCAAGCGPPLFRWCRLFGRSGCATASSIISRPPTTLALPVRSGGRRISVCLVRSAMEYCRCLHIQTAASMPLAGPGRRPPLASR